MTRFHRAALALCFSAAALAGSARAADESPTQVVQSLCDALITSMKAGPAAGFAGRKAGLDPVVRRDFDLALMTRLVVGPPWRSLTADQQQQLVGAFGDFSVANYANQFSGFSGQSFAVDPNPAAQEGGDVVVHTTLKTGDPDPVKLDYRMRRTGGEWRIIDIYLNGTISQLAARRSEFGSVLRTSGANALIDLLKKKTSELSS